MANELLAFLQRAPIGRRDPATENPFLRELGIAELVAGPRGEPQGPVAPSTPGARPATGDGGVIPDPLLGAATGLPGSSDTAPMGASGSQPANAALDTAAAPGLSPVQETISIQGSRAVPQGEYRIPSARKLADAWQQVNWMAAGDPLAAKWIKPQQEAVRNLAMVQHRQAFDGDPTASAADAARYARHWGEFAGWFGEPMSAEEASRWAAYRDGAEAKEIEKAKRAIVQGDWTRLDEAVQVLMPGWKFEKVEDGTYPLGGLEVPTKKVTVIGPTGERQVIDSTDFELGQANLETRIKLAEAKAKAEQAKAGETTQALTQANQELKARIDNRDLQQQWDNPQAPGTAAPTGNLTDLEKEAVKSYYDRLKEIDKLEASPEVKTRLREEIGREMAPALGRVMPWLAGQGGPSAEFQSLVNGDAEAAGGPAAGRESSVEERAMQARQAQDQARGARERAVQDDALRKRLRTMLMQREALRNDEAGRQQALEDLKRMDKLLPSDLAMIDSLYQMLSGTQPLTNPSPSSARLMFR